MSHWDCPNGRDVFGKLTFNHREVNNKKCIKCCNLQTRMNLSVQLQKLLFQILRFKKTVTPK